MTNRFFKALATGAAITVGVASDASAAELSPQQTQVVVGISHAVKSAKSCMISEL